MNIFIMLIAVCFIFISTPAKADNLIEKYARQAIGALGGDQNSVEADIAIECSKGAYPGNPGGLSQKCQEELSSLNRQKNEVSGGCPYYYYKTQEHCINIVDMIKDKIYGDANKYEKKYDCWLSPTGLFGRGKLETKCKKFEYYGDLHEFIYDLLRVCSKSARLWSAQYSNEGDKYREQHFLAEAFFCDASLAQMHLLRNFKGASDAAGFDLLLRLQSQSQSIISRWRDVPGTYLNTMKYTFIAPFRLAVEKATEQKKYNIAYSLIQVTKKIIRLYCHDSDPIFLKPEKCYRIYEYDYIEYLEKRALSLYRRQNSQIVLAISALILSGRGNIAIDLIREKNLPPNMYASLADAQNNELLSPIFEGLKNQSNVVSPVVSAVAAEDAKTLKELISMGGRTDMDGLRSRAPLEWRTSKDDPNFSLLTISGKNKRTSIAEYLIDGKTSKHEKLISLKEAIRNGNTSLADLIVSRLHWIELFREGFYFLCFKKIIFGS